jgi:hypothetical protein
MGTIILTRHDLSTEDPANSPFTGRGDFDSIRWALETHLRIPDTGEFNIALLIGNEDSPDAIHFWRDPDALAGQVPDLIWTPPEEEPSCPW